MAFKIDEEQCIGCGVCESTCKTKAIIADNDKFKIVPEKCTDCGECSDVCPVTCISGTKK